MQDTEFKEFDQLLRSRLADAEVKPSRRVWKGVSARLAADAAPVASPWGWMKWAGMSLAAAAAIAAGIFFSGTRTSIPTNNYSQEQAIALAQTGEVSGAPTDVAAPEAAPVHEAGSPATAAVSRKAVRSSATQRPGVNPATTAQAGEQPAPETTASLPAEQPQEAPVSESGSKPAPKVVTTPTQPFVSDPFAGLEPERRASRPRIALYAQGSVGSNDANLRPAAPGVRMAPGIHIQDDFYDLGGSTTFGVPFTLGVGVRFYVTPRLSVGSGIDYSLLTRTFMGSYQGTSGTVSHTIQYLGIPVRLYYDILTSDRIKFYAYGGGELEFCIGNKYRLFGTPDIVREYGVKDLMYSVGTGLGVEFRLGRTLGLYLDPGVNYYFPGNQPRSIRTDKPLMLNFDAGLRFNF